MRVLLIVVAAITTGCATTGATPHPFPTSGRPPASAVPVPDAVEPEGTPGTTGYAVSGTALSYRGVPYRLGGADPNGFDCSGLVWYVYAQHGLTMPRTVEEQYRVGETVAPSRLEAGDLVFFSTTSRGASHVGIVIGGDSFVHAPASNGVVRVERLGSSYWSQRYVGARRVF
jgi:cell wall-associated NlpC family hydrolase